MITKQNKLGRRGNSTGSALHSTDVGDKSMTLTAKVLSSFHTSYTRCSAESAASLSGVKVSLGPN